MLVSEIDNMIRELDRSTEMVYQSPLRGIGLNPRFDFSAALMEAPKPSKPDLRIKKLIFNRPATIVFWKDGTKTVVKCGKHETFDPEKGLAMAACKKFLGNKGNFNNWFKKALAQAEEK